MTSSRKTRIVYVNHTGLVSGAEHVLLNLLQGLDRARYETYLICPERGDLAAAAQREEIPWLPLHPVEARFTWRPDKLLRAARSVVKAVWEARKLIRSLCPDLVHANSPRAGIVSSLATFGTSTTVIWHVHDILPRHPMSTLLRLIAFLGRRTQIVAVSHATAKAFSGLFPFHGRVHTIHNGTNFSRFPVKQAGESQFRDRYGIPTDSFLMCAIGQICARKGLRELLQAFCVLQEQAPTSHLAIVGKAVFQHEERYCDLLVEFVQDAGLANQVHFTGELRDVSPVLQAADLLVLNSFEEPFGLVLVEAMSSGTPVLATRVGGVPEIVTDSQNGWLVERGDTAALASKLLELYRNRGRLKQAASVARETTCPQFSLERFLNKVQGFYSDIGPFADLKWNLRNRPAIARSNDH